MDQDSKTILNSLQKKLEIASKNTTLLFLGDNIYPKGIPANKNNKDYNIAKQKLVNQFEITKQFKGNTIFIPGNHDWYSGLKGLENQEKLVTDYFKEKKAFSPRKGCAIEDIKINDNVILVTIDSQWF